MKRCVQCGRAGNSLGTCGSPITCPPRDTDVEVKTDGSEMVLDCRNCDVTYMVPVGRVLNNRSAFQSSPCTRDQDSCLGRVMVMKSKGKAQADASGQAPDQ